MHLKSYVINTSTRYSSFDDKYTSGISVVSMGVVNKVSIQFVQIHNFQSKRIYSFDKFTD